MDKSQYPNKGLYCPAKESHRKKANRLLAALDDDAVYLHCCDHDWVRVEFYVLGKKISLKNVTAVVEQVSPNSPGDRILFDLDKMPVHAKGIFKLRKRGDREIKS